MKFVVAAPALASLVAGSASTAAASTGGPLGRCAKTKPLKLGRERGAANVRTSGRSVNGYGSSHTYPPRVISSWYVPGAPPTTTMGSAPSPVCTSVPPGEGVNEATASPSGTPVLLSANSPNRPCCRFHAGAPRAASTESTCAGVKTGTNASITFPATRKS